jgi:very-short-patch-repair endonuclease
VSTREDQDQPARSPKPDVVVQQRAYEPSGAARSPNTPVARLVWAPEPVLGTGDGELARVAEAQRGCLHRWQLLAAALTRHGILHRLRTHRLHPLHRDVYLWGRPRAEPLAFETAAILHFAGHAVLSHASAAWIWGLIDEPPGDVSVTCVGRDGHGKRGLEVRRASALHGDDIALCQGLPVTSPARTVVDLAGERGPVEVESALAILRRHRLASQVEVQAAIARAPFHKGVGVVRGLLATNPGQLARTRSRYERRLLGLIRDAGLPRPQVNAKLDRFEVDLLWAQERVIVEFDGFAFHGERRAFERDRERDRRLAQLGFQVIRVTARQLDKTPIAVIAAIATVLARRGGIAA